ncbi:MAG: PKD domain-containing protein, partial [Thermoplasmata archaeon]|nr:PKD domain-containing protein [Thermoplasmata archaeon]
RQSTITYGLSGRTGTFPLDAATVAAMYLCGSPRNSNRASAIQMGFLGWYRAGVALGAILVVITSCLLATIPAAVFRVPAALPPVGVAASGVLLVSLVGPSNMTLGSTATLRATANGGTPPYLFHWNENGTASSVGANATLQFTPTSDTIYDVNVSVNDSGGNRSVSQLVVSVTGPSPVTVVLSDRKLGEATVEIFATPIGGTPPYNFSWTGPGLGPAWSGTDHVTVANLSAGTYRVSVEVRDGRGFVGSNFLTIVSNPAVSNAGLSPYALVGLGIGIGLPLAIVGLWLRARRAKTKSMRPGPRG